MLKLGIVKSMAKEMMKEIGNKSREFYEFVLPPVDMHLDDAKLTVIIDIPGFKKEEIKLTITENILSINAEKNAEKKEFSSGNRIHFRYVHCLEYQFIIETTFRRRFMNIKQLIIGFEI